MPAWKGSRALFGTNPVAAVFPRNAAAALTIDLSLSEVARGQSDACGTARPADSARMGTRSRRQTDHRRQSRTRRMMLPAGGVKGAMLALIVELLCTSLTGAHFGYELIPFLSTQVISRDLGRRFLVIDPAALAGANVYHSRVEALIDAMCADPDVRLPGDRRAELAQRAVVDGVEIPDALLARLTELAESESSSV
jgi:(2R)-3-sulfolactate dehydrogenase (NADP+)